jgi:uncharacterized protein (TIGR03435 family)
MTSGKRQNGRGVTMASILLGFLFLQAAPAQVTSTNPKLTFDVASLRENKSGSPPSGDEPSTNVPLGPGNVYSPIGGLLTVRRYPLITLIAFAYRMTSGQTSAFAATAPAWVRDTEYDLQARTEKLDVTKDELRLMMRSLLAERFNMVVHYESRMTSVFAAQLVKPGIPGPRLRPHPADGCSRSFRNDAIDGAPPPSETIDGGFPATCGGLLMMSASTPTHYQIGARDVSVASITNAMPSWGDLGRPVVDQTGLTGNYDFALEFIPRRQDPPPGSPAGPGDAEEPNFLEAVKKQLGIKLDAQKQSVEVLLLDHIDHLSDN